MFPQPHKLREAPSDLCTVLCKDHAVCLWIEIKTEDSFWVAKLWESFLSCWCENRASCRQKRARNAAAVIRVFALLLLPRALQKVLECICNNKALFLWVFYVVTELQEHCFQQIKACISAGHNEYLFNNALSILCSVVENHWNLKCLLRVITTTHPNCDLVVCKNRPSMH